MYLEILKLKEKINYPWRLFEKCEDWIYNLYVSKKKSLRLQLFRYINITNNQHVCNIIICHLSWYLSTRRESKKKKKEEKYNINIFKIYRNFLTISRGFLGIDKDSVDRVYGFSRSCVEKRLRGGGHSGFDRSVSAKPPTRPPPLGGSSVGPAIRNGLVKSVYPRDPVGSITPVHVSPRLAVRCTVVHDGPITTVKLTLH